MKSLNIQRWMTKTNLCNGTTLRISNLADVPFKSKCAIIIFPTSKTISKINHHMLQWCGSLLVSMRIRIQFLSQWGSGSREPNHCGSGSWSSFKSQKVYFLHEKYTYGSTKAFLKPGLFINLVQFPCSWIQNRIPSTDPDAEQPIECGSMRIRIHNTDM